MAQALGKPLILISQEDPARSPFNIKNLVINQYRIDKLEELTETLMRGFMSTTTPNEMLRGMLVPASLGRPTPDSRFVVAASPLSFRRAFGRSGGYNRFRRTSSDYVGIRGIFQAFGLLYGVETLPDNLDPEDFLDEVIKTPMNIYCIASPKANNWSGILMNEYCSRWAPRLQFRPDPACANLRNVQAAIFQDGSILQPPGWPSGDKDNRNYNDFGLIIRGPNPYHHHHMATVLAGRSSLGTEAACLAFTHVDSIYKIREILSAHRINLEDHTQPFYVLVSMKRERDEESGESIKTSLTIHQVQPFKLSS